MVEYRIQKFISNLGFCSRRRAEDLIREGRIIINGKTCHLGDKVTQDDIILIDGNKIINQSNVPYKVLLLNKPIGFICTCKDTHGRKTIMNLLPQNYRKGFYPIGRLDLDSRGAILVSNHGELTYRLTHPKFQHTKTYIAKVKGIISTKAITKWKEGVILDGKKTQQAEVKILSLLKTESQLEIIIREGRKRQIRRVADLLGHPILDLKRICIADIELKDLPEGRWRELNAIEWNHLLDLKI